MPREICKKKSKGLSSRLWRIEVSGQAVDIYNTITISNDTARFIPLINTVDDWFIPFWSNWEYDQIAIEWQTVITSDIRFDNFNMGDITWGFEYVQKGRAYDKIAPLTKWNVKKFAVLPLVVGIYFDTPSQHNYLYHRHSTALDDFLANPNTEIPPTDGTGVLLGYSYGFKIIYNGGYNYNNTDRSLMLDIGFDFSCDNLSSIMGGYGQLAGLYSYEIYSNSLVPHKIYTPMCCANTLLGLAMYVTDSRGATNQGIDYMSFAQPVEAVRNTSTSYGRQATTRQIYCVGDLDYIEFTQNTVGVGVDYSGNHTLSINIPIIKNEYMNKEFLLDVAGQLGMPIITTRDTATSFISANDIDEWWEENGNKVYIPNLNIKTGEVKSGVDIYDDIPEDDERRTYIDSDNPLDVVEIMDTSDIDTNNYTDDVPLNTPTITAAGKFNRYYALSEYDLSLLLDFLYTNNQSAISDMLDGLKLNGENPMNFLISLKMFPFDLTEYGDYETEIIGFGNGVSTGITAEKLNDFTAVIDLGSCKFRAYNKNFFDYEPYTTAKLYIPYCGEVSISTAQCVGHEIGVKLIVDIVTGSCCGVVCCDKIPISYSNGNIAVEIAVTGENATQYMTRGLSDVGRMVGGVVSGLNGNTSGFASALLGAYDFNNMATPLETNGTSTAQTNFFKPQYCYFVVQSPILLPTERYGYNVGYACEVTRTLNEISGFTVCQNVTNITPSNATLDEIEEIKTLLESGVYL